MVFKNKRCDASLVLALIVLKVRGILTGKSSTSVTYLGVIKSTERRRTCERIYDGIPESDLSSAHGYSAGRDLLARMNYRGTGGRIQGRNDFSVQNAARNSCDQTTSPNILKHTRNSG